MQIPKPWVPALVLATACGLVPACSRPVPTAAASVPPAALRGTYNTEVESRPVRGEVGADALKTLIVAMASDVGVELRGDGRLGAFATAVHALRQRSGLLPPERTKQRMAYDLGLPEPTIRVELYEARALTQLSDQLRRRLPQVLRDRQPSHFGAHLGQLYGQPSLVLVMSRRLLTLEPVPRELPEGGVIEVRGRLHDGLTNPRVELRAPSGITRRLPAGRGPDFHVRLGSVESGAHELTVAASTSTSPVDVARFRIVAGSATQGGAAIHGRPRPDQPARAQLLRWVRQKRRESGLPPLTIHPGLDAMAAEHSAAVLRSDANAEPAPPVDGLNRELHAAGLGAGLLLVNVMRALDVPALQSLLGGDAGRRANLLHPDVTHLGLGVQRNAQAASGLVVTQLFARMSDEVDTQGAARELLALLNRTRRTRSAAALVPDEDLSRSAATAAARFFSAEQPRKQQVLDQVNGELERFTIAYRRVAAVMAVTDSLHEAAALEPALAADVDVVGIGVAQGDRPDTGPRALAVVYLLGWRR